MNHIESNATGNPPPAPSILTLSSATNDVESRTFKREDTSTERLVDALVAIVGNCRLSAVSKTAGGDKLVIPVSPEVDVRAVVTAHVIGTAIDVKLMTKTGSFTAKRGVFGFYTTYLLDGETWTQVLVLDIDVAGKDGTHKKALTPVKARKAIGVLQDSLRACDLKPILVRSPGGSGWHIMVRFPRPVHASFAKLLGDLAKLDAGLEDELAVETFPKSGSVRPDGFGCAITLPCAGRPFGVGGGMVQDAHGGPSPDPAALLVPSDQEALDRMVAIYAPVMARLAGIADKAAVVKRFKDLRFSRSASIPLVSLDVIAHQLGEVLDDELSEPGIIKLRCPKHGGDSLHVHADPEEGHGWWRCHACNASSGGRGAPESLVRWLMACSAKESVAILKGMAIGQKGSAA